jgi:hypothetical protein
MSKIAQKGLLLLLMVFLVISVVGCGGGKEPSTTPDRPDGPDDPGNGFTNSITRHGITWQFDGMVQYGQFINGDYWVIGPVKIIKIDPSSINDRNGSMINPFVSPSHGYDSRITWDNGYDPNKNVALGISAQNPLIVDVDSSLVSSISRPEGSKRPFLETAAVLTVLEKAPPKDSFRPGFAAESKEIKHTKASIRFDRLPRKQPVDNMPSIEVLLPLVERVWLDHAGSAVQAQYMHPIKNMRNYGREIAGEVSQVGLYLCLDHPDEHIEQLLINFLQVGIDLYSVATRGSGKYRWTGGGGQNSGRKWPILFAGLMLDDASMLDLKGISFQEDQQTYYGEGWTGATVLWSPNHVTRLKDDYEHKHPSEWTVDGRGEPGDPKAGSNSDQRAESYRMCCSGTTWPGMALSAHLMNAVEVWDHPPYFDYCVRWMNEDYSKLAEIIQEHTGRAMSNPGTNKFVRSMWEHYHW